MNYENSEKSFCHSERWPNLVFEILRSLRSLRMTMLLTLFPLPQWGRVRVRGKGNLGER